MACALNSACLALIDANIPLKHTFAAVNCSLMRELTSLELSMVTTKADERIDDLEAANSSGDALIFFPNLKQEKVTELNY